MSREVYREKPESWSEEMWRLYLRNVSRYPTDNDNPSLNRFVEHFFQMCDNIKVEATLTFEQARVLLGRECDMCGNPPRVGRRAIVKGHVWPHNYIGRRDYINIGFTPQNSITKCRRCIEEDIVEGKKMREGSAT